jgi:hypothetical protein
VTRTRVVVKATLRTPRVLKVAFLTGRGVP